MKKKIYLLLALVMTVVTASAQGSPTYSITVDNNDHGTVRFKVGQNSNASSAAEGDLVTVTVTPNTGYTVNTATGIWDAAIAASRGQSRAQDADLSMEREITLNYVSTDANGVATYTFEMIRANAIISASYKRELQDSWIQNIFAQTYTGQELEPNITVRFGNFPNTTTLVKGTDYTVEYSNNINAGTATVTITAVATSQKYSGTASRNFTINKRSLNRDMIAAIDAVTYSGTAFTPEPAVTYNNMTLEKGTDYTYGYSSNVNAGTATVTVTATSTSQNYTGSASRTFTIQKKALTADMIADIDDLTHTGEALTPKPVVTYNDMTLVEGTDYRTLTAQYYQNNVNAGTATVTITARTNSNYSGSASKNFTIQRADITPTVPTAIENLVYNGEALALIEAGSAEGGEMQYSLDGTNYSADIPTATDAKEYTVYYKVVADDNHNDVEAQNFKVTIGPKALTDGMLAIEPETYVYNATENEPTVTVTDADILVNDEAKTLVKGTDYTVAYTGNKNVGEATVTVTGTGNYSGTLTAKFTITKAALTVTAEDKSIDYGAAAPTFTVSYDGFAGEETETVLGGELGFDCSYVQNTSGRGTYDIMPKGLTSNNYEITFVKGTLTVGTKALADNMIAPIAAVTYTGSHLTPAPVLTFNGMTLAEGTDYTLSYTNNLTAGTGKVTATGKGNYSGTATATFTIMPKALETGFVAPIGDQTYTGGQLKPVPVLTYNGMTLEAGTDFTVTYENNVVVGTAKATITGQGDYSGTVTANFAVVAAGTQGVDMTLSFYNVTYDGKEHKPAVTVMFGETELVEGVDYDVAYRNNTNVGTAKIIITLKGNFTGTIEEPFVIDPIEGNVSFKEKNVFRVYDPQNNTYTQKAIVVGNGQVTYKSSDKKVATVNAKTGVVQIVGAGSVVITATVSDSETYSYEGDNQASYTIRVDKATPTVESEGFNGEYDGKAHGITVIAPEGCIIMYGTTEGEYNLTVAPTYVEQGTYTVYFCVYSDNYKLVKGSETVVIGKGTIPGPGPNPQVLRGDINADGVVDGDDLALFIGALAYDRLPTNPDSKEFYRYDANADGHISIADAQAIFNLVLGRPAVSD